MSIYELRTKLYVTGSAELSKLPAQTYQNLVGLWYLGRAVIAYAKGDEQKSDYWELSRTYVRSGEIAGIIGASLTTGVATYLVQGTLSTFRRWGIIKTGAFLSLLASLPAYAIYATYKDSKNPFNRFAVLLVKMASQYFQSLQTAAQDRFDYWRYRWHCSTTFDRSLGAPLWTMVSNLQPGDKIGFSLKYLTKNNSITNQAVERASTFEKLDRNLFPMFQAIQERMKTAEHSSYDPDQPAILGDICTVFKNGDDQQPTLTSLNDLPMAAATRRYEEAVIADNEWMQSLLSSQGAMNTGAATDFASIIKDKDQLKNVLEEGAAQLDGLTEEEIQRADPIIQPILRMLLENRECIKRMHENYLEALSGDDSAEMPELTDEESEVVISRSDDMKSLTNQQDESLNALLDSSLNGLSSLTPAVSFEMTEEFMESAKMMLLQRLQMKAFSEGRQPPNALPANLDVVEALLTEMPTIKKEMEEVLKTDLMQTFTQLMPENMRAMSANSIKEFEQMETALKKILEARKKKSERPLILVEENNDLDAILDNGLNAIPPPSIPIRDSDNQANQTQDHN